MKKHLLTLLCVGSVAGLTQGIGPNDISASQRYALTNFSPMAGSPGIVISQVYGGGGNTGATYTNDYIELFNRGTSAVDVSTWSVQYAGSTGTSWSRVNLTGSIPVGGYYLIQLQGGTNGVALPAPDVTSTAFNLGTAAGKVALVRNQTIITAGTSCPVGTSAVVDFIGYGTGTDCREGTQGTSSNAAAPSVTTADTRVNGGCQDNDNNSGDFAAIATNPRNSGSPRNTNCTVLPVKLLSFDGTSSNNAVNLNWVTAWEEKNEGFDVLKGLSATGLEKVGFVPGKSTTLEQSTYAFADADVQDGQLYYYQLRQRDIGGGSELSKIIAVRANAGAGERTPTVYPNPSKGAFTVSAQGLESSGIRMYNAFGAELPITASKDASANTFAVEPAASLPAGAYFLKLQPVGGAKQTLKVIVH